MATNSSSSTSPDPALDLAIIGGGIAGLCLALSTAQHAPHISLTLYEAASKFGEIGAGVAFGPNAVRTMSKISPEVQAGFERVRTGNQTKEKANAYFTYRVGMNGKDQEAKETRKIIEGDVVATQEFKGIASEWGRGMVHRASFLDEMVKLVPDSVNVKFGHRLIDLKDEGDDGILLKFDNGKEARHAAALGCDGIKSRTRVILLGEDDPASHAVFTGKYCYRGLIPMEEAIASIGEDEAANSSMYFGYHGHMLTFPVQKGKTMNVVAFSSQEKWEDDQWVVHADRQKMYKDFESWGKPVQKILEMMQKPDIWALFNHLPAKTYTKGRLCLTGDAAHASTPHQGSGAGMAVEDSYVMSQLLQGVKKPKDFQAAFVAFDEIRRPRTQKLVSTSKDCGMLFDFEKEGIEDDAPKIAENILHRMDWIWQKDIDEDLNTARTYFEEAKL